MSIKRLAFHVVSTCVVNVVQFFYLNNFLNHRFVLKSIQ